MEQLFEQANRLLRFVPQHFHRYLLSEIRWNERLIGIVGARGTGKTTMLLQWLKGLNLPIQQAAYFSLDDLYFTQNSLKDTLFNFYKSGGRVVVLDEAHRYAGWSTEIKNAHDFLPDFRIVFTGSSIIDITSESSDLSRRALMYELPGLSYREYLALSTPWRLSEVKLETLLTNATELGRDLPQGFRPLEYFDHYLRYGYYPFGMEQHESMPERLQQLIRMIVESDLSSLPGFDVRNARKMLQLIYVIAQQVPFTPNISALAQKTGMDRRTLGNYLHYLNDAKVLSLLYPAGSSVSVLQKPEKIYLQNTNLMYALGHPNVAVGAVRETFLLSQILPAHTVTQPKKGDFLINDRYTLEVGGKSKSNKQIAGESDAWLVKDQLETGFGNTIPLWMFGLLY